MQSFLKSIIIVAFILFLLAVSHGVGWTEQRLALVIGNAGYSFAPLKNPVNDASDMAVSLQKLGFTVILKKNVNLREMEEAIQDFGNRLKQGGVGLFYFAGHGLQAGGVNYLVPVGAKIDKESDIKYEAVDAGKILDEMADALDMGPTAGVAGHWTSLDERHYRGLSPLGASASVAKGELVLWSRNDSDRLIWFLTLAGEQIGHHIAEPGEDEDNPPIEWADEVYEALGSEEHTADGGMN